MRRARCILLPAIIVLASLTFNAFPALTFARQTTPVVSTPEADAATPAPFAVGTLDLAAVALRPEDLEAAGLTGAAIDAATWWAPPADDESLGPEWQGVTQYQLATYFASADPGDPEVPLAAQIDVYTVEYVNAAAAAAGFPSLRDQADASDDTEVADAPTVGDESELTGYVVASDRPGETDTGYTLDFRDENIVVSISVLSLDGSPFEPDVVQALGEAVRERLAQFRRENGPQLRRLTLRLGKGEDLPFASGDHYLRLDGQALRQYGEPAEIAARREAGYHAAVDVYFHQQPIPSGDTEEPLTYVNQILDFPDESAAAEWLANVEAHLRDNPVFTDVTAVTAPTYGDESITLRYRETPDVGNYAFVRAFGRVGARGMIVGLQGIDLPPGVTDAVDSLASKQTDCLRSDDCSAPTFVPLGLRSPGG